MKKHNLIAAGSVVLAGLGAAPALAAGDGPTVSVRIEALSRTLLPLRDVTVPGTGSITKDGVAAGQCLADTAQGALQVATQGEWTGTWYPSYKEYDITGVLGHTPNPKKAYIEIFVNNVATSVGACEQKLKYGDKLLFAVVPDAGTETPLGISAAAGARAGLVRVKVVGYDAKGKSVPLKGAKVSNSTRAGITNAQGLVSFSVQANHAYTFVAADAGYIRDETTVTVSPSGHTVTVR